MAQVEPIIINYQSPNRRRLNVRHLALLLFALMAAGALIYWVLNAKPLLALYHQWQCRSYDGGGSIVYRATRASASMGTNADFVAPDLTEDVLLPRPNCWLKFTEDFPVLNRVDLFDSSWRLQLQENDLASESPCPFVVLHDRLIGSDHAIVVVQFTTAPALSAAIITPATLSTGPEMHKLPVLHEFELHEYRSPWDHDLISAFDNSWRSIVVHAAVMDPVDESHFSIDMIVDSHPTGFDCYLRMVSGSPCIVLKQKR